VRSPLDAAAVVGEQGRLISTDFSAAMVAAARRRGAERGLGNVESRVMDAERIELEADSVDGVLCRFGYMLWPTRSRHSPRHAGSCARAAA
jgi:ubiquinone/menaquinone biosynthesis C-methylase UbiE